MSAQILNVNDAKTRLSAALVEIEKTGESYIICHNGKPVATLSPFKGHSGGRLQTHPVMSNIEINYDPTEALTEDE